MPTASNQKLNRNQGQSKQNYSAIRYGNDKGSISFGTLDKKATVTSGVKLDTNDGRHQFNLEIDGNRKGWTSSTSPGHFQVECGSDKEEADDTLVLNALNGNICITATNGKIVGEASAGSCGDSYWICDKKILSSLDQYKESTCYTE